MRGALTRPCQSRRPGGYRAAVPEDPPVTALIRPARPEDAEAIAALYAPYVTGSTVSFETDPPDPDELAARMAAHPTLPWLVAVPTTDDRRPVARLRLCGTAPHRSRPAYRWSIETSVYVAEPGRGTGTALLRALLDACARAGYVSAYAGIALPGDASIALHEKLGFTAVGVFPRVGFKHGRWIDVGWWYRSLDPAAGMLTR